MVTLESAPGSVANESAARTTPPETDPALLSPPINTWKAHRGRQDNRSRHRPTRSQSAPPAFILSPTESVDNLNLRHNARAPRRSFAPASYVSQGMTMKGGELVRPPPPLLRPTTFWRRAHRSGVAAPTFSPAAHLIRRSTYIAAGLSFDAPMHDLSALCVETRNAGAVVEIPAALELFNI